MTSQAGDQPKHIAAPLMAPEGETLIQGADEVRRALELSAEHIPPPAKIPGYQIQRCLGEGAYGSVWLAREENTGKFVAIKFYNHRQGLDWPLLNREVAKLAVLYTSRNIVGLLDVGWDSDPPYYVMEFLENGSLANRLEHGPLPAEEGVRIARTVLSALVHAHGSGILHCDLKPANVLLDGNFEPRLADFGQSRLSHEQHSALGTLFYMAPEQADFNAVPDAQWDVYGLGALLYHTLCGEAPRRTPENERAIQACGNLEERLEKYREILRNGPPPTAHRRRPGVDKRLAEIVDRCLEIDPAKRYPNAQAVLDALDLRTRQRARQPLLTLGIAMSVLLLLGMLPLVSNLIHAAVQDSKESLIGRALESDAVTARILARSVEWQLERRRLELLEVAADPRISGAIAADRLKPWNERTKLRSALDGWRNKFDRERERKPRQMDVSWLLTDSNGIQIYRNPYSPETIDKNFAWRDYFHGPRRDLPPGDSTGGTILPLKQPYVSLPFQSEVTDQFMVAISVPIRDKQDQVIGVLSRTLHLGQLLTAYDPQLRTHAADEIERIIALVDVRGCELLDHPWMTDKHLKHLHRGKYHELRLEGARCERLMRLQTLVQEAHAKGEEPKLQGEDRDEAYEDPVGALDPEHYGGLWLAAYWPVGNTGWTAVVQEHKAVALQPVEHMHTRLVHYVQIGFMICCGLIGGLWYFILKVFGVRFSVFSNRV